VKGKGATDTVFIVRQMQEKFRAKGKMLYFHFVSLEKASGTDCLKQQRKQQGFK